MVTNCLLDYDGFICKAFYAAKARIEEPTMEDMDEILINLRETAIKKAQDYAPKNKVKVYRVVSGHTYKKDIYPSYKAHRQRDELLGQFREYVKYYHQDDMLLLPQLEADDVITMLYQKNPDNSIVFSDDKDLRYYCPLFCKINLTEDVRYQEDFIQKQLEQMLIGDKEDGITGIPKVGEKTAAKLLESTGYNVENVIRIYKEKDINIDECLKNLVLVTPICIQYNTDFSPELDDKSIMNNILGHFRYFNEIARKIYDDK